MKSSNSNAPPASERADLPGAGVPPGGSPGAEEVRACLLIPTYDNAGTLADVVARAVATGFPVIVVDDGSTDATEKILASFEDVTVHRHERNRGKGAALQTGFELAEARGYTHAVALDSDGQHLPEDAPRLVEIAREDPEALIVGARDLEAAGAGWGSRFGCAFSNFWLYVETGQRVADTQTGFRVYPLRAIRALKRGRNGFSFEVEVLVRASWSGVRIRSEPVRVVYPPGDERVSHFRPVRDFVRIGFLNAHLCTLRVSLPAPYLALISERRFAELSLRDRLRESARNLLQEGHGSTLRVASSVALGLFMGITPFWGFQVPLTLALAHVLRASKAIAVLAAHVSIPVMIPPILYASLVLGRRLAGETGAITSLELDRGDLSHWVVGSFALAALVATAGFFATWIVAIGAKRTLGAWKKG